MFDFTNGRITLVISPVDMRSGFASLAGIARTYLSIDVYKGGHLVLFINRNRGICKLIWTDQSGCSLLTRRLHAGRFEKFLAKAEANAVRRFTRRDLESFLDGRPVLVERTHILSEPKNHAVV
jgi:putative transposase IS66, Orf2